MTAAAQETADALAERGGRALAVGDEGVGAVLAEGTDAFDVVWSTWPHRQLPPVTELPLVTTFHDLHWRYFWSFAPDVVSEIEAQMPAWLERTALFVSSSEFIRGQLCEEYAVGRERTRVVPLTGMRPLPGLAGNRGGACAGATASPVTSCSSPTAGTRTRTTWRSSARSSSCARRAGR